MIRWNRGALPFVVLGLLVLAVVTYAAEGPGEMNDLEVFHRAGARFLRGEPLYRAADGHFELKYLPVAGALFAPLSLIPLGAAKVLWLAVCALSLSCAFVLAARLLGDRLPAWAPAAALLVLARSIEREFANGQINALLLLLVVGAFVLLEQRRDVWAGVLIAVVVLLKPPWLVLVPYLLVARRWQAARAVVLVVLVGLALPAARYGVSATVGLHGEMNDRLAASTARLLTHPANISLPGALAKLTGAGLPVVTLVTLIVLAFPCVAFGWRVWRRGSRPAEDLAVLAPVAVLISPQAWDYTVLTTLPALLLAANVAQRARWPFRATTLVLSAVVALDYFVLFGRGAAYAKVMSWSPNGWFVAWMLGVALWSACVERSTPNGATSRQGPQVLQLAGQLTHHVLEHVRRKVVVHGAKHRA